MMAWVVLAMQGLEDQDTQVWADQDMQVLAERVMTDREGLRIAVLVAPVMLGLGDHATPE